MRSYLDIFKNLTYYNYKKALGCTWSNGKSMAMLLRSYQYSDPRDTVS